MHTLKGIIRVYDRDKSGNAIQLFVQTEDFVKYIIENSGISNYLFDMIDKEVILIYSYPSEQYDIMPHIVATGLQILN